MEHAGVFDGFESYLYHFPDSGHIFVWFENPNEPGYPLALQISKLNPHLVLSI